MVSKQSWLSDLGKILTYFDDINNPTKFMLDENSILDFLQTKWKVYCFCYEKHIVLMHLNDSKSG